MLLAIDCIAGGDDLVVAESVVPPMKRVYTVGDLVVKLMEKFCG